VTGDDLVVGDAPEASRYEARIGDRLAGASFYERVGNVVVFSHTEVDTAFEGQGVGGRLVRGALDDVRRQGGQVVARCPFVRAWLERHPDYQDLVIEDGPAR
jgi:predicted GNAT family acetyltransferase